MIRFWITKRNRSWLQLTAETLAVSFLFTTISAPFVQANLWQDRRIAAKELQKDETLLARLPSIEQNIFPTASTKNLLDSSNSSLAPLLNQKAHIPSLKFPLPQWVTSNPLSYATLKKVVIPSSWKTGDPIVIYIQDAHLNKDAQRNIGKSIQHFIAHGKPDLVALEGAFGLIDLSSFREFPNQDAVKKVADYLLKENNISGAIHTAFTSPRTIPLNSIPRLRSGQAEDRQRTGILTTLESGKKEIPSFVGVDDRKHYDANVEAYKRSYPKIAQYKEQLHSFKIKLEEQKSESFSQKLKAFDQKVQLYRNQKIGLGEYIKIVASVSSIAYRVTRNHSQIMKFLKALEIESSLNFKEVEKERAVLLEKLIHSLSKAQMQELLNVSMVYRLGNIKHADFYLYLQKLCEQSGVDFKKFPAMDAYLKYVLLSDEINADKLFEEVKVLEEKAYQSLTKSKEEKEIVAQSKALYLTEKLVSCSLTREEWKEYKRIATLNSPIFQLPNFLLDLRSFEDFYQESFIRDEKIANNLLNLLSSKSSTSSTSPTSPIFPTSSITSMSSENRVLSSKSHVAVLVTGGFHSEGIEALLNKSNVTVITYTPKIAKVDIANGSAYLSVFTQEKTPLQKLFDGEKLFLPSEAYPSSLPPIVATHIIGVEEASDSEVEIPDEEENLKFHGLVKTVRKDMRVYAKDIGDGIAATTSGDVTFNLELDKKDGSIRHTTPQQVKQNIFIQIVKALKEESRDWQSKGKELWLDQSAQGMVAYGMMIAGLAGLTILVFFLKQYVPILNSVPQWVFGTVLLGGVGVLGVLWFYRNIRRKSLAINPVSLPIKISIFGFRGEVLSSAEEQAKKIITDHLRRLQAKAHIPNEIVTEAYWTKVFSDAGRPELYSLARKVEGDVEDVRPAPYKIGLEIHRRLLKLDVPSEIYELLIRSAEQNDPSKLSSDQRDAQLYILKLLGEGQLPHLILWLQDSFRNHGKFASNLIQSQKSFESQLKSFQEIMQRLMVLAAGLTNKDLDRRSNVFKILSREFDIAYERLKTAPWTLKPEDLYLSLIVSSLLYIGKPFEAAKFLDQHNFEEIESYARILAQFELEAERTLEDGKSKDAMDTYEASLLILTHLPQSEVEDYVRKIRKRLAIIKRWYGNSANSLAGYKGFEWEKPRSWWLLPGNINHELGHMITGLMAGFIALPFFPIKYRTTIIAGIGVKGYFHPHNEWEYEVRRWRLALFYAGGFLPVLPVLALLALTNFFPFNSIFSPAIIYALWAVVFVLPYFVDVWLNLPSNRKTYSEKYMTDLFQFLLLRSKGLFTVEKGAGLPIAFTMAGKNEPLQVPISRDKMIDTQPFLETFTKNATLLENQDLVNKTNELLEKRDLVNEANDFVAGLFKKDYEKRIYFKPCLRGFKVVEIPEYGFLSGEKLVPFFHDPDGFIYLTRGLYERILADPFNEQILFELAVHHSFRLNFLSFIREGGSAERFIQAILEGFDFYAKTIFILNYLPVVSQGRLKGEQEKGFGPFHIKGDETEAAYYLALFLERYARFRKLGYRPQGSDRMIGGPEDTYMIGVGEWVDFRDRFPNKSFLTFPGKLSEFLENLEDRKEIKVGAETIKRDEIDPEFRANLAGENLLYIASLVYDYSPGAQLDMSKIFGALDSYKEDRFVTGLLATFVRRYGRNQMHFMRDLFEKFKAEELIQIIVQLNRLGRKVNLEDKGEHYGFNETDQLMNILYRIVLKYSLDSKIILGSLEKLNTIFDLLNRNVRPLGKVGEVVSILNKFLDKSGTQGELCLTVFQEILSSTDPKNLTVLLRIIFEDTSAITNLDRIKSLLEKIKERDVDFTDIERANQLPLSLVELILTHSSFPNKDLRTVSYHGVIGYKLKENVPEDMEALYSRGYRWMDALFFKGIENFLEMEKEIEQRISQDPHFVPTIRTIHPHQDWYRNELSIDWEKKEPHLNLMIFASKFLKTDSGQAVPFRVIESLWIYTANALNPLFPKEYDEQKKVQDSFNDLKDRLCRIGIRMLKKENEEIDPILFVRDLNILVQRMSMAEVESLLESLEIALEGTDQELINPFIESLTYFAETMSYEEGRDEIIRALENLRTDGIAEALESALQRRLDYEAEKFPEIPLEKTISRIDGLDKSQKAELQEKLQVVLAFEQELVTKTQRELKARALEIRSLVENQALSFDEVKLEYLAILREISKRLYGMRAYNVQLASTLLFFENSEMNPRGLAEQVKTGEGKSLIIALTAGMSSLSGKPVDIFTVNSYLAKRDAIKFKRLYDFLGLTVDHIKDQDHSSRKSLKESNSDTFSADIVYGTNSNFEFLYLYEQVDQSPIRAKKSNGVTVKREFATAIVDEVDSLFLDEAVNPHLISGFGRAMPTWHYQPIYQFFKGLTQGTDFHGTELTSIGEDKYRDFIDQLVKNQGRGKAQFSQVQLKRYARSALQAERIQRDVDYVVEKVKKIKMTYFGPQEVEEEDIIIMDKATGRKREGSVWNHGLHQFVQIKEGISPREEFKPGASITHPFYFKFYKKIFAITGTIGSDTDEKELLEVYGLKSLRLPNHKPSLRIDMEDYVARTLQEKWDKVVEQVELYHKQGRPVLVGVMTIRESEELHKKLRESGIEAQLLNGSQNQPEETIIQRAGYKGVVTVATNLAGRGTDILLGPGVVELGGLHVIGTQRFDARRVDDQLRGRAGRQGQPGSSQFIISLQDEGFRRYLGPLAVVLGTLTHRPQETRREMAIETQKAAEIIHYQWRVSRNRIYSVQDNHMNRFFKMVGDYFNVRRIYEIFPELVAEYQKEAIAQMDSTQSLFLIVREKVFDYWTNHLQLLEDLTEDFEDETGPSFEEGFSNYKRLAEESFQDVLEKLKKDVYSIYGGMAGLSETEVAERIDRFKNGSGEGDTQSDPQAQLAVADQANSQALNADGSAVSDQDNSGRGKSDGSSSSESVEITFNDLVERCRQASFPFDPAQLISILLDTKKLKSHKERIQIYFWFMRFPDISLVMEAVKDLAHLIAQDSSLDTPEFRSNLSDILRLHSMEIVSDINRIIPLASNPGGIIFLIKAPLMAILKKLLPQERMPRISNIYDLWIVFVLENWLLQNFVKPFMPTILHALGLDFVSVNAGLWGLFLGIHILDYLGWKFVNVIEYAFFKTQNSPRAPPPSNMHAAGIISILSFAFGLDPFSLQSLAIHFLTNFAGHYIGMFRTERKFVEKLKRELYDPYFEDAKNFPYDEASLSTPQPENWGTSVRDRCVDKDGNPTLHYSLALIVRPEHGSPLLQNLVSIQEGFSGLPFAKKFYATPSPGIHFTALLLEGPRKEMVPKDTIEEKMNDFEKNLLADLSAFDLWVEGLTMDKTSGRIMAQVFPIPKKDGSDSPFYLLRRMNPNARPRITITLFTPFQPLTENEKEELARWLQQNRNRIFGRMHVNELELLHTSDAYGQGETIKSYGLDGVARQRGIDNLFRNEDGQAMTEYGLIAAIVAVLAVVLYRLQQNIPILNSLPSWAWAVAGIGAGIVGFGLLYRLHSSNKLKQALFQIISEKIGGINEDLDRLNESLDRSEARLTESDNISLADQIEPADGIPITTSLEESVEIHEKFILDSTNIDEIAQKIVDLYEDQNVRELVVLSSDQRLDMPLGKQYRFAASCVFGSNLAKPMDESGGFISLPVAVTKDSVKELILMSLGPLPEVTQFKLFVDTYSPETKVAKVVPIFLSNNKENVNIPSSDLGQPVDSYKSFYDTIRQSVKGVTHISEENLQRSRTFLTLEGDLKSFDERSANGVFGITEVYFLPESKTRERMAAFQDELKQRFGNKLYFVDADKLHFTTQGLEQQWDNRELQTKKELAMHNRKEDIDPEAEPFATVRRRAHQIETPVTQMQVGRVNWNPEIGIFWELRPRLKAGASDPILERYKSWEMNQGSEIDSPVAGDPILDRRKSWDLPQPRPPHITAAYFTQAFSEDELRDLRKIIAKYQQDDYFGDIVVDKAEVIAYEDLSFNAGVRVLEVVPFVKNYGDSLPNSSIYWFVRAVFGWSHEQAKWIGISGLLPEIFVLIKLVTILDAISMGIFLIGFTALHIVLETIVELNQNRSPPTVSQFWKQFVKTFRKNFSKQFLVFTPYLFIPIMNYFHADPIFIVASAFAAAAIHVAYDWKTLFGKNVKHPSSPKESETLADKTQAEQAAKVIASAIADRYEGKEINRSKLLKGLKKILNEDLRRGIENISNPFVQNNLVLQTIHGLNEDEFKAALAKEFMARFKERLSEDQAYNLAAQVVLNGFSTKPLEEALRESEINSHTLQISVVDPANPVKYLSKALKKYKIAAKKLLEGEKLSVLFILKEPLSLDKEAEIRKKAGKQISISFLNVEEAFGPHGLNMAVLDKKLFHWENIEYFDHFSLILPIKLAGDLSKLKGLGILGKAVIHFIDELFNSLPVMRVGDENFEKTLHAIALIAEQA